jgi:hypothetical protein
MGTEIDIPTPGHDHPAERAMIARLRDHGPELIARYLTDRTRNGVTFIARDAAKLLFPEYIADPTANNRYSDRAASALAEAVRRHILNSPPVLPRNEVAMVTGTPASGKSISASEISGSTIEIVHETILTSLPKATQRLQDAFRADRLPQIIVVYTNDPRINVRRMVQRARRIGRTVPLAYMAETYVGVPLLIAQLRQVFGKSLLLTLMNNSGTEVNVGLHRDIQQMLAEVGQYTVEGCLRVMDDELGQINQEDPIPPEILKEAKLRHDVS